MTTKVVILYSQSLFAAGIESRLRHVEGLAVIRVDASEAEALQKINEVMPDVVIVDGHDRNPTCEAVIPRVLSQDNAARVISLNLNSKEISIYRREGREVMTS